MSSKKISEGLSTNQVSVSTTPTLIAPAGAGREAVTIVNGAAVDVFLGGPTVSTTTGVLLAGTKGQALTFFTTSPIYGVVAAATSPVSYADNN